MASYPTTLPLPTVPGYAITPADATLRSDMEKGSARVRQITSTRNDQVDVAFDYSDEQFYTFRQWWDNTIAFGSVWFTMDLALGDSGIVNYNVRPVGTFKAVPSSGLRWGVSLKLEVRNA